MRPASLTLLAAGLLHLAACQEYEFTERPDPDVVVDTDRTDTGTETDLPRSAVEDQFRVGEKVDIIMFGDTSGSMSEELGTMGIHINRFVDRLALGRDDWQLAAVTGPDGCAQQGIITPSTPDYAVKFANGILTPGGDEVDEWGLHNVAVAAEMSAPGQCNEGLVRDGALLHIIFITDEDDNSPDYLAGGDYWRQYVERVRAAKGDGPIKYSAVAGPVPGGCTSDTNSAEPGTGYWEAVQSSEGQFISICDDWAAQIELFADVSNTQDVFPLSKVPITETLRVTVDTEERTDFQYRVETNDIRFAVNPPIAGAQVVITYESFE